MQETDSIYFTSINLHLCFLLRFYKANIKLIPPGTLKCCYMEVEAAIYKNQETASQNVQTSLVELAKSGYERIEQEKGSKALAYHLGMNLFQARLHSLTDIEQASQAFLPRVLVNFELREIFQTAIQHQIEEQEAFNALFNSPHKLSEQEEEEKLQQFTKISRRNIAYMNKARYPKAAVQRDTSYCPL